MIWEIFLNRLKAVKKISYFSITLSKPQLKLVFLFVSFNSRQAAIAEKSKWALFDNGCNKLLMKVFFLSRNVVCWDREGMYTYVCLSVLILKRVCPYTKEKQGEWPFSDLTLVHIAAKHIIVMGYVDFSCLCSCSHYQLAFSKN